MSKGVNMDDFEYAMPGEGLRKASDYRADAGCDGSALGQSLAAIRDRLTRLEIAVSMLSGELEAIRVTLRRQEGDHR